MIYFHHVVRAFGIEAQPVVWRGHQLDVIAIVIFARTGDAIFHSGIADLAKAGQLLAHNLGFEAQLRRVGDVLPLATAARAKVLAGGFYAVGCSLYNLHQLAARKVFALMHDLDGDGLAGQRVGHKYNEAVIGSANGFAGWGDVS